MGVVGAAVADRAGRVAAHDLVPKQGATFRLCSLLHEVAFVDPRAAFTNVALKEDREPWLGNPMQDGTCRLAKPSAPARKAKLWELGDIRQRRDDARDGRRGIRS